MGWSSLFLKMNDMKVLVVGTGEVGTRRAKRFLKEGSEVVLIGSNDSDELIAMGAIFKGKEDLEELVDWADLVVVASGDKDLNEYVASISNGKLLNRADFPEEGNLIVPTSFYIDDVQISIFTNGKSPLMARELRKKIQKAIDHEDILQIKIQEYARSILKTTVSNQKDRKKYLYTILENKKIKELLNENKIEEAKEYTKSLMLKFSSKK